MSNQVEYLCYCFKYSKKDLLEAINNGTEENVIADIKDKMKNPGCFCETANPSGNCCLKDLADFIKQSK
jgi:hypothetical protein